MTPWQSRHDSPLPLQTSQMSYTAGPFGVPAQSRPSPLYKYRPKQVVSKTTSPHGKRSESS